MKSIRFNVSDFMPVVNKALGVVNGKASLNILNDLIIKSKGGENAVVKASDGEIWLTQKATLVKVEDFEEVCFAVNARDFASVLGTLAGNVVTITLDEESNTITGEYVNGEFKLPYDDPSQFPSAIVGEEECSRLSIGADRVLCAIDNVKFASSTSEVHKVLNGVRFNVLDSGIETEATDMIMMSVYYDTTVGTGDTRGGFTLPNKATNLLSKILCDVENDITVSYNGRVVMFENESFKIVSRLQEGNFPSCSRVVKRKCSMHVTVCRKDVQNALKRVIPMSNTASQTIKFCFETGVLTLSSEDVMFSKAAKEQVKCDYDGERFVIGLKGSLISGMLSVVDYENIIIGLEAPKQPAIITPETSDEGIEHIMLLMPIQLNENV